jgi:hypothetical protein
MKKLILLIALASGFMATHGQAMHWTQSGSPYLINGNITVGSGQSLIIDPGVEVVFTGNYRITADGPIYAIGDPERPIVFRSSDTTGWYNNETGTGGWAGIRFSGHPSFCDSFRNCIVRDIKHNANSWQLLAGFKSNRSFYMDDCTFFHNKSVANSSPYRVLELEPAAGQTAILENSEFYNNEVGMDVIGNRGDGLKLVRGNNIHDNTGGTAIGAIFCRNLEIRGNEIHHNKSLTVGGHSAISLAANSALVSGNTIHHNYSKSSAAIASSMGKVIIEKNYILNNTHDSTWICGYTDGGGALHLSHNNNAPWDSTEYIVRNNVIANNYAPYYGGALYSFDAKIWFMNNTVVNNTGKYSGAAIYIMGTRGQLRAKNNIITGNKNTMLMTPPAVESIRINGGTYVEFSNNYVDRPVNQDLLRDGSLALSGNTGNIIAGSAGMIAPTSGVGLQIDAINANFRIQNQSACVNAGDSIGARASATDIAEHIRVVGKIDIGAYETDVKGSGTGIENVTRQLLQLGITPNPAKDLVTLLLPENQGHFVLVNVAGAVVYEADHKGKIVSLPVGVYPRGIYMVRWQGEKNALGVSKIVLQ